MFSSIVLMFELIGTVAFSISGAMVGIRKHMDIFGILILGLCTAVGGGVVRDLLLGNTPPVSFVQPIYAGVAALSVMVTLHPSWSSMIENNHTAYERMMLIMDSAGLGIFTVVGIRAAILSVETPGLYLLIFVGVITGVGGGILRDVLAGDTPYIFSKHFYASASIIGALVCAFLWSLLGSGMIGQFEENVVQCAAMTGGAAVVFVLRMLAAHYEWNLPRM